MNNSQAYQAGYTLIELLLYIAMMGILLSALVAFFGMVTDARVKNQSITEVNEQGAYALEHVAQTVRNATSISAPTIGTSTSQLTLVVPTAALSPTVFSVVGGVLQVKEGSAAAVPLTSSKIQVTAFTVANVSRAGTSGIVKISLTINRLVAPALNEYDYARTFTTSAGVRP
jgi:type II secretory pathway pseudopilin PulG